MGVSLFQLVHGVFIRIVPATMSSTMLLSNQSPEVIVAEFLLEQVKKLARDIFSSQCVLGEGIRMMTSLCVGDVTVDLQLSFDQVVDGWRVTYHGGCVTLGATSLILVTFLEPCKTIKGAKYGG
jgi:hypothetical protein